jgi:pimeloyl-ACP methyl ester carboxylesterase
MRSCRNICHRLLLVITLFPVLLHAQQKPIPYGANDAAGHYLQVSDAKIYYETYGSGGTPLVLLHGGIYGYIDEFGDLIQEMSQHRRVIAIATRGHGRSEMGTQPFSYALFASDAFAIIQRETHGKVDVLGFSVGAIVSYLLADSHPDLIRRMVAIGGPRGQIDWTEDALAEFRKSKPSDIEKNDPQFVASRKKLMPAPERWEEFVTGMAKLDQGNRITDQQIHSIQISTLIMAGDRDPYNRTDRIVETYHLLPNGQLAIIPGCGHVVLDCNPHLTIAAAAGFLDKTEP